MLLALILACASANSSATPPAPTPEPPPTPEVTTPAHEAQVTAVEYHFQDSSVPPPSHRSVTIRVSAESADYVVDSYGDVVAEAHAPSDQATLDKAIAAYEAAGFKPTPASREPGCSGGTSRSVTVEQARLILFTGTLSRCGGSEKGLEGDMDGFAKAMKALAPMPEGLLPQATP